MFGEKQSGSLDMFLNDYIKDGGLYGRDAFGMNEETFADAISVFNDYVKKSQPDFKRDVRSVRLDKGQDCPVCDHEIRQEMSQNSGKDYENKCAKCGLTEESSQKGTHHQLSLEEFQWAYRTEESDDIVKERAEEEGFVLSLYRKIWSGVELSTAEDAKLEEILASQKEAMLVK